MASICLVENCLLQKELLRCLRQPTRSIEEAKLLGNGLIGHHQIDKYQEKGCFPRDFHLQQGCMDTKTSKLSQEGEAACS